MTVNCIKFAVRWVNFADTQGSGNTPEVSGLHTVRSCLCRNCYKLDSNDGKLHTICCSFGKICCELCRNNCELDGNDGELHKICCMLGKIGDKLSRNCCKLDKNNAKPHKV